MAQKTIDGDRYDEFLVRTAPNERLPVDIGSATVNLNGDIVAEFDGVEEALGSPNEPAASNDNATSGLVGLIKRLLSKLPTLQSGAIPIGDNSSSLTVDSKAYRVALDITRPANQTAYPAGGVIGTGSGDDAIHTLANIGPSGGFVLIQSIELVLGISAVPSGMTSFRLHFFRTKPTTAAANASAFDLAVADRGAYMGYIDMPAPIDLGATCFTQLDYSGKLFQLAAASTSMFVVVQTIGGFTPAANSEVYSLRVKTLEAGL